MAERRGVSIWLVVSLAINAALIGVVGGRLIGGPGAGPPGLESREDRKERFQNLSQSDRRAFRREMGQVWRDTAEQRRAMHEARRRALAIAVAEPYDGAAMADVLEEIRSIETGVRARLHAALLSRIKELKADQRVQWLETVERPPREGRMRGRDAPRARFGDGEDAADNERR